MQTATRDDGFVVALAPELVASVRMRLARVVDRSGGRFACHRFLLREHVNSSGGRWLRLTVGGRSCSATLVAWLLEYGFLPMANGKPTRITRRCGSVDCLNPRHLAIHAAKAPTVRRPLGLREGVRVIRRRTIRCTRASVLADRE